MNSRQRITITLMLLGITFCSALYVMHRPSYIVVQTRLDQIPLVIEKWKGKELHFSESVYTVLDADANVYRRYISSPDQYLDLYIGYYGTAKGGRASHLPQYCYTGQGWNIKEWDFTDVGEHRQQRARVNRMIVEKGIQRQLVYFWFQADEKIMATGLEQNMNKLIENIYSGRSDGTFVRVSTELTETEFSNGDDVEEIMSRFSRVMMQFIDSYWPVEKPIDPSLLAALGSREGF